MLCAVIKGSSLEEAKAQIVSVFEKADILELRLDHFADISSAVLQDLRSSFPLPMIFTLRGKKDGGNYPKSEEERLLEIERLAKLEPEYFDLEDHLPILFVKAIVKKHPHIKIIISHHDFESTPYDLDKVLKKMQKTPAHLYKMALMSRSSLDALKLLLFAKDQNVVAVPMGDEGTFGRALEPFTYAAVFEKELGQLSVEELSQYYNYHNLNRQTALYGLIGNPVSHSMSYQTHNAYMKQQNINAVYVKMRVPVEDLPELLHLAKQMPFQGLSVTTPLKEKILPYLDEIDDTARVIGAVNTLLLQGGKYIGFNTDGKGALNAIEKKIKVKGKKVVIIGAGGASKAIAYEAARRGASVTIVNRHKERAELIAKAFNCKALSIEEMSFCVKDGYDILINATSYEMPIQQEHILKALVMDITNRFKDGPFLKCALEKGCEIMDGTHMFFEQAALQFNLWFK